MNLLKISWKNIHNKPLDMILSVMLLAFGVGMISLMVLLDKQFKANFERNIKGIDLVLGAKGSPLQLILANVYHVDASTGNIDMDAAKRVIKHPSIEKAIPLAYGDYFQKWKIVGTTSDYPQHYNIKCAEGTWFVKPFEATIGSEVAKQTGLKLGSKFKGSHDLNQEADEHDHSHDAEYTVVGILEQSNTALDNLLLTPLESVWLVHAPHDEEEHGEEDHAHSEEEHDHSAESHEDHDHEHEAEVAVDTTSQTASTVDTTTVTLAGETHEEEAHKEEVHEHEHVKREVSAYLLVKRTPMALLMLPNLIKDTNMQLALPAIEANRLNENFGIGKSAIRAIAILIMILSFVSIFISLYNSLKDRKYELALMRSMGGSRAKLFTLILQEGLLLVLLGFTVGMILSRVALYVFGNAVEESFHYSFNDMGFVSAEAWLLAVTLLLGILASLLPAIRVYKMDISKTLSND